MRELLLCPPDYYGIEYEINPWMSRARGAEAALAQKQWRGLHAILSKLNCKIELVPPQPKLPDMVFTANAGLAVGKQFIPSNFRHKERAGEAPHFASWMEKRGFQVSWLSNDYYFEGEGDALFAGDILFCGYKFGSDIKSHRAVAEMLGCLVVSPELVDLRFACKADSILPSGRQFITSDFVSQPFRAMPTPNHKSCNRSVRCASGLITHLTPCCFASGHQRQSRSSRFGAALSSIQVPVAAAGSSTAGISTRYGSRFNNNRPVGCPRMVMNGFSIARMIRLVISASERLKTE